MVALVLTGYALGSVISYFIVSYIAGYRRWDHIDRQLTSAFAIFFWPAIIPGLLVAPYFGAVSEWAAEQGVARRKLKETPKVMVVPDRPEVTVNPYSYRDIEINSDVSGIRKFIRKFTFGSGPQ